MIRVDLKQGSDEWFKEKLGKPSVSNFDKIITSSGSRSKSRKDYMYELVAERLTGHKEEGYKSEYMQQGNDREAEARYFYELSTDLKVEECGVIYKDEKKRFLCSPDGICKESGLEIKCVIGKTQVKYLINNRLPSQYFAQVQGSLYITGFETWDFLSYCPGMEPLLLTIEPDEDYHLHLAEELEIFCDELDELTEKLRKE